MNNRIRITTIAAGMLVAGLAMAQAPAPAGRPAERIPPPPPADRAAERIHPPPHPIPIEQDLRRPTPSPGGLTPVELEDSQPEMRVMSVAPPPCPGKADLQISGISTSLPLKIFQNTNQLQVTVRNAPWAGAPAGNFFVKAEVCPASGPCQFFGQAAFNGGSLPKGGSVPIILANGFYTRTQPGLYRIKVTVDTTNMVSECNEANNTKQTKLLKFVPHCSLPDFFSYGTGPNPYMATMTKGQNATVSISYVNQGAPYSGPPVPVKLFLRPSAGGPPVPVTWTGALNPGMMGTGGQQHFTMQNVQIPTSMASGQYQWVSLADPGPGFGECDKANNWTDPNGPKFQVN